MPSRSPYLDIWLNAVAHTRSRSPATFKQWFSNVQFDRLEAVVRQSLDMKAVYRILDRGL